MTETVEIISVNVTVYVCAAANRNPVFFLLQIWAFISSELCTNFRFFFPKLSSNACAIFPFFPPLLIRLSESFPSTIYHKNAIIFFALESNSFSMTRNKNGFFSCIKLWKLLQLEIVSNRRKIPECPEYWRGVLVCNIFYVTRGLFCFGSFLILWFWKRQ